MSEYILVSIIFFALGSLLSWVIFGISLLTDKRFVKKENWEVLIHKNDLNMLIAAAPKTLKDTLSKQSYYTGVKKAAEQDLEENKNFE